MYSRAIAKQNEMISAKPTKACALKEIHSPKERVGKPLIFGVSAPLRWRWLLPGLPFRPTMRWGKRFGKQALLGLGCGSSAFSGAFSGAFPRPAHHSLILAREAFL